jgi:hypothetical protein
MKIKIGGMRAANIAHKIRDLDLLSTHLKSVIVCLKLLILKGDNSTVR